MTCHVPRERVSWNLLWLQVRLFVTCHAPRERVSWNNSNWRGKYKIFVTLHVSVWVEIWQNSQFLTWYTRSRSTWACELKCNIIHYNNSVFRHAPRERVSWNTSRRICKIKYTCHAPRERVSWNVKSSAVFAKLIPSRSTWACELKFTSLSDGVDDLKSRSTWACELKYLSRNT